MQAASLDFAHLKSNMKASWMAGDFGQIANFSVKAAEEFVARTKISPGTRVLDVACGTGNTAVPAARAGGLVTGVDIASNLLEQARKRAVAENLEIRFQEGDAEDLPVGNHEFDVVLTMFGAMFAPPPGAGGCRIDPGVQAGRTHCDGELDAGRICRKVVSIDRGDGAASSGPSRSVALGERAGSSAAVLPRNLEVKLNPAAGNVRLPLRSTRSRGILPAIFRTYSDNVCETRPTRSIAVGFPAGVFVGRAQPFNRWPHESRSGVFGRQSDPRVSPGPARVCTDFSVAREPGQTSQTTSICVPPTRYFSMSK